MSTNQKELLEKHEEWQDTIDVKPKIKTNIKMRVTPEQSKKVQEICYKNGIERLWGKTEEKFAKQNRFICITKFIIGFYDLKYMFETADFEEIDADLFIRTNGTCIEKEEFTYPMWFRYKVFNLGYIVRFDSLITGEVIPHHNWTLDYYICNNLTPHTNTKVWEQVEEPKEIKENHNEHYKKQKIDTIARCKANMTLEQQKAICIFSIDKYVHREKGQNLADIQKVRYYLDWLEEIENKLKEEK